MWDAISIYERQTCRFWRPAQDRNEKDVMHYFKVSIRITSLHQHQQNHCEVGPIQNCGTLDERCRSDYLASRCAADSGEVVQDLGFAIFDSEVRSGHFLH